MKKFFLSMILICLFVLSLFSLSAFGETVNCTNIAQGSTPVTISNPGVYCLKANKTVNGETSAVTINADNVTIDLNGFELKAGNPVPFAGITADSRSNITIKNGIVNGFTWEAATYIVDDANPGAGKNTIVENLKVINGEIRVDTDNSIIRNNQIMDLNVTDRKIGIVCYGANSTFVVNNDISNTGSTGIHINKGHGVTVEGNRITNTPPVFGGSVGIDIRSGAYSAYVVNNRISNMETGIEFQGPGQYRDNMTQGCTTGINPGVDAHDAGGNTSF